MNTNNPPKVADLSGQDKPVKWVKVYCTSANCRGKKNGGKGHEVWVPEGTSPNGTRHYCNECFCQ